MMKSKSKSKPSPLPVLIAVIIFGGGVGYFGSQKFGASYFYGLGAALTTTGVVLQASTEKALAARKKSQP